MSPNHPVKSKVIFNNKSSCAFTAATGQNVRAWNLVYIFHHWETIDRFSGFCTAHGRVSSGTLAPSGEYDWNYAHWRHLANTIELVLPLAHPNPQYKLQINRFSHSCTAHGRKSLYFTVSRPFPKKLPILIRVSESHLTRDSLGDFEPTIQTSSWSVQLFSHGWPQSVPILYNGPPLSPKIVPSHGGSGMPWKTWFHEPIWAYFPNGILIGSAVFAQITAECPYTLQWDALFPLKIAPSHGDLYPHLIHGSWILGPPESSTQTASGSVQPFLQDSLVWQTGRPTDLQTMLLGR